MITYIGLKSLEFLDFQLDWSDVSRLPIRHQIQFAIGADGTQYSYYYEEDESSFQLVDTSRATTIHGSQGPRGVNKLERTLIFLRIIRVLSSTGSNSRIVFGHV